MKGASHLRSLWTLAFVLASGLNLYADALDSWTNVATSPYGSFRQIAYGNGIFVASSATNTTSGIEGGISTSSDGKNWIHSYDRMVSIYREGMTGVAYGNGVFVVIGYEYVYSGDGGSILYSTNGSNWNEVRSVNFSIVPGLNGVAFGNGVFVAVGFIYDTQQGYVAVSTNGQNWSFNRIGTNVLSSVAFGDGIFLAAGRPNGSLTPLSFIYSVDGVHWNDFGTVPVSSFSSKLSYVNGAFYAIQATNVLVNTSGFTWTQINRPVPSLYIPTSSTNHLYVAVGPAGAVLTSTDNTNWITRNNSITNNLTDIIFAQNEFVAVGTNGGIFLSGSALPSLSAQNQLPGGMQLTVSGGLGPTYQLQASTNFSSWTNLTTFTNIGVSAQYLDSSASNFSQRFYRTISP